MFRTLAGKTKNIVKMIVNDPDLYEKQVLVFAALGMTGGIYMGAKETRRFAGAKFMDHITNISIGGTVGAVGGLLFGMSTPLTVPVGIVCGLASLGMYGYNKLNPVIPWHQQKGYKTQNETQIDENEGFMVDIKNKKTD